MTFGTLLFAILAISMAVVSFSLFIDVTGGEQNFSEAYRQDSFKMTGSIIGCLGMIFIFTHILFFDK